MIKFEKISYEQFKKDFEKLFKDQPEEFIKDLYENIKLPTRGTTGAAGYDFSSPIACCLDEECSTVLIPTGVRVQMPQDIVLKMYPRSGLGFKTGVRLANTVGIIDSDYYYSDNEGHIMIKLVRGFSNLLIMPGDRIAQGIFEQYFITEDDNTTATRNGGFGSTGK